VYVVWEPNFEFKANDFAADLTWHLLCQVLFWLWGLSYDRIEKSSEAMRCLLFACLIAATTASYTWDSCGTRLDRLKTAKLSVAGSLTAGSKVTVTASGTTDLHVPLETGAWQVRVYEDGEAHSTHSEVGDLMQALKFDDAKNTTFTVTVSFTLPAKQASGKFNANLVATDQAKSDYMCLDVKYAYAATPSFVTEIMNMVTEMSNGDCTKDSDCPSSYCNNGFCHGCFDQCCEADSDCTKKGMSYCAKDSTKMPPYFCHA
jgi:hypothetical protein